MERLLSAVAPTGTLHIGNYVGAIRNWLVLQHRYDSLFCVADLHALTAPWLPDLENGSLDVARVYLASGIDPAVSTIFLQSQVPQHAELCWILAAFTKVPQLQRMTQYKDKTRGEKEKGNLALLSYPVLMAGTSSSIVPTWCPWGRTRRSTLSWSGSFPVASTPFWARPFLSLRPSLRGRVPASWGLTTLHGRCPRQPPSQPHRPHGHAGCDREKIRKAVTRPGERDSAEARQTGDIEPPYHLLPVRHEGSTGDRGDVPGEKLPRLQE